MRSIEKRPDLPLTVSAAVGELTWLYTQSVKHQAMSIRELGWLVLTPVLHRQFHFFREGARPIGAAIWAMVDDQVEAAILSGKFSLDGLGERAWHSGNRLWLIELLAPFSTRENRHAEVMLADLMTGVFQGRSFDMMAAVPGQAEKQRVTIDGRAGERLTRELQLALSK